MSEESDKKDHDVDGIKASDYTKASDWGLSWHTTATGDTHVNTGDLISINMDTGEASKASMTSSGIAMTGVGGILSDGTISFNMQPSINMSTPDPTFALGSAVLTEEKLEALLSLDVETLSKMAEYIKSKEIKIEDIYDVIEVNSDDRFLELDLDDE